MQILVRPMAMLAVMAVAFLIVADSAAAQKPANDKVVAIVDGHKIFLSQVEEARQSLPAEVQGYPFAVLFEHLVGQLVDGRLLAVGARRAKLQEGAEFKRRMADIEDRLLGQMLMNERVTSQITENKLREQYETFTKSNPGSEEIHARHILVETSEQAVAVIKRLEKGEEFVDLAKAVSTGPSASSGGDLGFFSRERMVPEFSEAAFRLKRGEVTPKPVKTQFGWHVIKVEERRSQDPPTFSQAKVQIRESLSRELQEGVLRKLRDGAKIKRFGIDGNPAKPQ